MKTRPACARIRVARSIRFKLFAVFLCIVFAPFAIFSYFVIERSAQDARSSAAFAAGQLAMQAAQFIEAKVDLVTRSLNTITLDGVVRELSMKDPGAYSVGLTEWNIDSMRLGGVLLAAQLADPELMDMRLYMARGLASAYESASLRRLEPERGSAWAQAASEPSAAVRWFRSSYFEEDRDSGLVYAVARIPDNLNLQSIAGFARAGLPESRLAGILDKARFSERSTALILDSGGETVAISGPEARAARELASSILPTGGTEGSVPSPQSLAGTALQAYSISIHDTGWRLALLVPSAEIDAFGQKARSRLAIIILIIAPLMLPLAYWVASRSTARLGRLAKAVRGFDAGNLSLSAALPVEGDDEIGELATELDRMASRIASLMEEKYELGLEVKDLELKALQAQINPHFLYNSLDLVNCLALNHGESKISEAASTLSRFYRLALSGGAQTVSLAQELEHVETYVKIQNLRFDSAIGLEIEVPEELKATPMPKLTLQPLAENAILHGILEKPEGRGSIAVRGKLEEGGRVLAIEIEDDGVGMEAEALERLFEEREDEAGFCVRNIDRRLKVKYGQGFGLSYRSEAGRGTTAIVKIPR
jgi:Predicted signal transduction protein with a C-terminal ATPase domain